MLSTPSQIGPRLFVQTSSYLGMNNYISGLPSVGVTTQAESFTDFKLNWTINLVTRTTALTLIHTRIWITSLKHLHSGSLLKRLNESFKNVHGKAGVQVHFKDSNIIKDLLVTPKDKDTMCYL